MQPSAELNSAAEKLLPWAAGFFLLVITLIGFLASVFAGFLGLCAFVISVPPANRLIINKIPKLKFLENTTIKWITVSIFVILSFFVASAAEKAKVVEDFNKNRNQIFEDVADLRKDKKFFEARIKLEKYAEVITTDKELTELYKTVSDERSKQLDKESELKLQQERNAQAKEKAKAASSQSTSNPSPGSSQPAKPESKKFGDADPANVAFCFSYLGVASDVSSVKNLQKTHKLYVEDNWSTFINQVQPTVKKFASCIGSSPTEAVFEECKQKLGSSKVLIEEMQKGMGVSQRGQSADKAVASAACMAKDAELRGASTVTNPPNSVTQIQPSDGRDCRVGGILHANAFVCSGSGDVCGMDEKTVVVINGSILPPHANNTTMIKVGYRCSCIRNSSRVDHDKIDCKG
jgi:hypothetical protein